MPERPPRPVLPVSLVPGQHSFNHVNANGRDYVVLRDKRGDAGVLIGVILVLLTPLVFPYGLGVDVFLILLFAAVGFLIFALRISLRKLYLSLRTDQFEVRFGTFASPRSHPKLFVPARVFVAPVQFGRVRFMKLVDVTPVGFGCLLHSKGTHFTVLALQQSRDDVLRLVRASPVLSRAELVEVEKDVVLVPKDPWHD